MAVTNISYDKTIVQTAGSSSSAAAAASPLPSADAGEEEHTGQVDVEVMIVVCRQFVIVGIVVIVAVVLLLRLVLWCDNICGCFAWKIQYLGNQRGIFAPNIFLSPGKMFIGCRDIQFFARSQGSPFFHRVSSPSRDLLPLFLTTIHNDSHRSMVNLSSIVVIK